ncbi:SusC/RagA family TonB-linked outer membrane protein [Xanthocytophaga flava]|uniref:SusC/RagA family TonB-linked outer membrane protein n=1 Tax=Xanthocytophaga flava TaxID=3048013 RepID=UPI0028D824AA|nr:SusC/RagA family TonB-linked outer membrane protein [Xanthocytophaga flavus]MDJ1470308.1 SusC/RagA family TonB-linked outer membrane protein [Xanthocytophaga flavus]
MKQQSTRPYRYWSIFFFLFLSSSLLSFGQEKAIRGKASAADGSGIPGVNVLLKGTTRGTATGQDGTYSLSLPQTDGTLVFSAIGYATKEISIGSQTAIDVTLEEDTRQLNEVIVTALGIKKESRNIGYASQDVKGEDLVKARESNAVNSLVGKVAGLTIGSSPELLGRPNIVLRGNTDVLFVVNGVPVNSDSWNLSADDIETYTVLKGANAAALYGSRGLNGAIVITTKKANNKGWQVDFNSSTMIEKGFLSFPTAQTEYGRGNNFLYDAFNNNTLYDYGTGSNNRRYPEWGPRFEGQAIKQYDSPIDPITKERTPTPWLARGVDNLKHFLEAGVLSTNNISLSTSGENYDIRVSGSHTYQKGLSPNTKLNVDNLNVMAGINFSSKWRLETNVNTNIQYSPNIPDVSYGPNSYVYMFGVYGSADYDVRDLRDYYKAPLGVNGLMQYNFEYGRLNNPYFMAYQWTRDHHKTDVYGSAKLSYKINTDLEVSLRTQVTTYNQSRSEKVPAGANLNAYTPWWYFGWYGDYHVDKRNMIENNTDLLLTYNKKLADWNLSALAGGSMRLFRYESVYATTKGLSLPGVYDLANSRLAGLSYDFGSQMHVYSGYYSVDLGYKNLFTISHTGRVDNLSTLPKSHNTFYYPSVSISSVISDYITLPVAISFLKVRASFADVKGGGTMAQVPSAYMMITGNSTGSSALLGYGSELYSSYDGPNYSLQSQVSNATYYNGTPSINYSTTLINSKEIKPFNIVTYEAGLDVRFLQNRLGLDVTYFTTNNGPVISAITNDPATGYTGGRLTTSLTTRKKGWEITIKGTPVQTSSGFKWEILANWSTYRETLLKIGGGLESFSQNGHKYKVGERMDAFYGTGFVRDNKGDIVFASTGGPLSATPAGVANNQFLGHLNPDFTFGINNKFSYKSFSFSFQFDGRVGGKIYDRTWYQMMNGGTAPETTQGEYGKSRYSEWQSTSNGTKAVTPAYVGNGVVITNGTPKFEEGKITNMDELTFASNTKAVTTQSYLTSLLGSNFDEYYMIIRTYAKLREVVISYKIPVTLFGRSGSFVKSASVSLIGRNLLYFASRKDFDIDQYASGYNAYTRTITGNSGSIDLSSPTTRRYGINLNFTF